MPGQGQEQQQEQAALALASAMHQHQQLQLQLHQQQHQHQGRDEEMQTPPMTPFMLPCSVSPRTDESERPPPTDFQRMSLAMDKLRSEAIATAKRTLWAVSDDA